MLASFQRLRRGANKRSIGAGGYGAANEDG
jgi:hypothetical protein